MSSYNGFIVLLIKFNSLEKNNISRVTKVELSEPTILCRKVGDQQIKVTPGITG